MELELLYALAPYIVAVLVLVGLYFITKLYKDNPKIYETVMEYQWLVEVAWDVVERVAFNVTEEEKAQYEQEAEATGRDVRLVIAYNELMQIAEARGYRIDLRHAMGIIERVVQLKKQGIERNGRYSINGE